MLDETSSIRLNIIRFPLIVGVVFAHAYSTNIDIAGQVIGISRSDATLDFVRNIISQGIATIAVPAFFLMSGYLFFLNFDGSKTQYLSKLKSRGRNLLAPFLLWNGATLLLIAAAQEIPGMRAFFSGEHVAIGNYGVFDYVDAMIGITRSPISYQFWFIRDLMILVMLVPALRLFYAAMALPFLGLVVLLWLFQAWHDAPPSPEALLFFSAGAIAAIRGKSLFAFDRLGGYFLALYGLVVIADVLMIGTPGWFYLHKFGVVVGVLAALFATRFVLRSPRLTQKLLALGAASFFVFASHEPLLTIARKIAFRVLMPESSLVILLLYFIIPSALIAAIVLVHRVLTGLVPNFVVALSGGR